VYIHIHICIYIHINLNIHVYIGTVVNIADQYDDIFVPENERQSIDLSNFDNNYKMMVKAPIRYIYMYILYMCTFTYLFTFIYVFMRTSTKMYI
jgi:hypothetical protein